MWHKVKELSDQHGYMSGVNRQSERVKATGEVFTPTDLAIEICQQLGENKFAPKETVIDPACGDGQFLVVAKWVKVLFHGMTEEDALKDIYGVDIMRDNVDVCKLRLGGGNIIMGDSLDPTAILPEQTEEERKLMRDWFTDEVSLEDFL